MRFLSLSLSFLVLFRHYRRKHPLARAREMAFLLSNSIRSDFLCRTPSQTSAILPTLFCLISILPTFYYFYSRCNHRLYLHFLSTILLFHTSPYPDYKTATDATLSWDVSCLLRIRTNLSSHRTRENTLALHYRYKGTFFLHLHTPGL